MKRCMNRDMSRDMSRDMTRARSTRSPGASPVTVTPASATPASVTPTSVTPTSVTPTSVTPTSVTPTSVTPTPAAPTTAGPRLGIAVLALIVCACGFSITAKRGHHDNAFPLATTRVAPDPWRVDLTTAGVDELALLPEVGPALAARIVADRAQRGPYRSIDELSRVRGIGPHTIAQLREAARIASP